MAGVARFQSRRRVGDWNRALTAAFLGARSTESRFFAQNKRGDFVFWKYVAVLFLVASVVAMLLGILSLANP